MGHLRAAEWRRQPPAPASDGGAGMTRDSSATLKHTLLPVSKPKDDCRLDDAEINRGLRERSRKVQNAAVKAQLIILAVLAVGLIIGTPVMAKNVALGFIASAEARAR